MVKVNSIIPSFRFEDLFLHHQLQSISPRRMHFSTGLVFLLTVLGIVFYYLQRKQEEDAGEHKNILSSPFDQRSVHNEEDDQRKDSSSSLQDKQCRHFSLSEIKLATNDFDDAFLIGKGGFGNVYKGKIDFGEGIDVAIKRLNLYSSQGATEFRAETEMLSKFRHSHIVSLLGYHEGSDKSEMILVYEYMSNGSLEDHLHKRRADGSNSSVLTWLQRLHICIGAARGLDYLHTGTGVLSRVIHRDVKSSNILLDENLAAKISDFGLSRIGPANQSGTTNVFTHQIIGTFGYMDAEYFSTHRLTRKSDVYAFGVVLLEVLCGRPALDFTLDEEQHSLSIWARDCITEGNIDQIIDPCLRGQTTARCLKEFGKIAYECILTRSKDRPTMTKVLARLEFVLDLASQKHGGATIAEKMWSLFSIKVPGVHVNRRKWSDDNKSKRPVQDKAAAILAEGSSEGKDNDIILVDSTKAETEGSDENINKSVKTEEPVMTNDVGSSDFIKEGNVTMEAGSGTLTGNLKIFTFDELRRATRNFRPSAMLGFSDGASVYKGWVDRGSLAPSSFGIGIAVAIKVSNTNDARRHKEWQAEVNRGKFNHPNLVKLLGYCSEDGKLLLVHEYIHNTNLVPIFNAGYALPWGRAIKIVVGIAKGLAFLHTDESIPMFRTFNASNILLNEDDEVQLYFGWTSLAQVRGSFSTSFYNSPEYMATGRWYVKSDVYAFGVMMLGMLAGEGLLGEKRCSSQQSLIEWARPILSDNRKLQRIREPWWEQGDPPKGASKAAELILNCLQIAQENRPSMKEIVATLEGINDDMYPKEYLDDINAWFSTKFVQNEI